MEVFIEKCTRIIKKNSDEPGDIENVFLTANPYSGHVVIEDNFGRICPIDYEVIPDLIEQIKLLHTEVVEGQVKLKAEQAERQRVIYEGLAKAQGEKPNDSAQ